METGMIRKMSGSTLLPRATAVTDTDERVLETIIGEFVLIGRCTKSMADVDCLGTSGLVHTSWARLVYD